MEKKQLLKKILKNTILSTASRSKTFRDLTGIGYFGLEQLDKELIKYLPERPGFYVELGANDGIKQSNTLVLERYYGWKGILIEPHDKTFQNLTKNRSKKNHFFNCACVSFDFIEPNLEMRYSDLMTIQLSEQLDILDPFAHAEVGAQYLDRETPYSFQAIARNLDDLLFEVNAPDPIDLLSIDVEGAEFQVLSGVDLAKWNISTICVESRNIERIKKLLTPHGYKLTAKLSHHDYLFKKIKDETLN